MPSALILIADGTEEMEFTISYDTLVRAGINCTSARVVGNSTSSSAYATCSRGVKIVPDAEFEAIGDLDTYDALVIPGGIKGAETLAGNKAVQNLVKKYHSSGKLVGMICAGTTAALSASLPRCRITSHPYVKSKLETDFEYVEESVVIADNLVTSRGPGTTFPFALTLVEKLCGKEKRDEVAGPMMFPQGH